MVSMETIVRKIDDFFAVILNFIFTVIFYNKIFEKKNLP